MSDIEIVSDFLSEGNVIGPNNPEIEEIVLGTIINYPENYFEVADRLSIDDMSTTANRYIFIAIQELAGNSTIDLATVIDKTRQKGYVNIMNQIKNGFDLQLHINLICSRVGDDSNFLEHVRILNSYKRKRKLFDTIYKANKDLTKDVDPDDILGRLSHSLVEIQQNDTVEEFDKTEALLLAHKYIGGELKYNMLKSYLNNMDSFIVGWEEGELVLFAGQASMGKTSFVLAVFLNNILRGVPGIIYSLEMTVMQMVNRLISLDAVVSNQDMRRHRVSDSDWVDIHATTTKLTNADWYIDDKARRISVIIADIRKQVIKNKVKFVVIDYLQLCMCDIGRAENRDREIGLMSRALKELAQELKIVIFALSQLNRENTKRSNKRPQLSDLRESGSLEQDADMVAFVHREAYYDVENVKPVMEEAEIIIAKGRHTGTGTVKINFVSAFAKFINDPNDEKKIQAYVNGHKDLTGVGNLGKGSDDSDKELF